MTTMIRHNVLTDSQVQTIAHGLGIAAEVKEDEAKEMQTTAPHLAEQSRCLAARFREIAATIRD